ncbi:hypothetical protein X747_22500 [Mesorhizobium sp. LNJC384A00]|nr:hypothetical protein X750_32325 [Mesorhizobium sp. LNJC394B00]ESY39635.1 hypothetical protein X747_22500 [Mesorhizobium sp. LNJC384A00]
MRRQIPTRRQRILGHLEDRIAAQPVGVVAVLVAAPIIFMRKPIMSARLWTTWSGQRGSSMQRARRSATRNRFSTSA